MILIFILHWFCVLLTVDLVTVEIDYTSGDIDATLSISSWSYAARDHDPEINALKKTSSLQSLPNLEGNSFP